MESNMRATVIVGSNNLFREGLSRILGAADFNVLDAITGVDDAALDAMVVHDCALFILDAGDGSNTVLDQIKLIKARNPMWRVVVLDNSNQLINIASVYRAGVSAYLANVATSVAFIKFLELVMLGETILPAAFLPFVLDQASDDNGASSHVNGNECKSDLEQQLIAAVGGAPIPQLSLREKVVLRCIIEGGSNKMIARKIAISEATVKVHVKSILRKIRVHSRTQAAIWGMNSGFSLCQIENATVSPSIVAHSPEPGGVAALPPAR
jgi:two-component system nitrate/nitrite response regulator NarL